MRTSLRHASAARHPHAPECWPLVVAGMATALAIVPARPVHGQDAPGSLNRTDAVRVFVDCQTRCDEDHFQREITFVDYVRDQRDADVHVLITRQSTGAGGSRYDLRFIGRRQYSGTQDSLRFTSGETDTDQEVRDGLTRTLAVGLVHYAAGTSRGARLQVTYEPPADGEQAEVTIDPWNAWVFRVGFGTFLNGESSSRFLDLDGSTSATRITDASKIRLNLNGSYSESSFDLDSVTTIRSIRRSYGGRGLYVLSLSPHWSAGAQADASVSTFRNFDLSANVSPALEYDVFPYGESTRRQFRFLYSAGLQYYDYTEETIFDETAQALPLHTLEVAYEVAQPWGSADLTLLGSQFLNDLSKNRVTLRGEADVRLVRGLSLSVEGRISHIADQLNLPRGDLSDDDILLQQRERATSFSYFLSVGLSFTFGSTFSSVVNPRFEG